MSGDVKHRPAETTANGSDWVTLQADAAGLGDEKRVRVNALHKFTPSILSAKHTATGTAQAQANEAGATKLCVQNLNATNDVYIGLGMSAAEAIDACTNGIPGEDQFLYLASGATGFAGLPGLIPLGDYTHHAYKGNGDVLIGQGV